MGNQSLADMLNTAPGVALEWHLTGNVYPPAPFMLEACRAAIDAANAGDESERVELPHGVQWRGQATAPARAIVEGYRLEAFLEYEFDGQCYCPECEPDGVCTCADCDGI